MNRTNSLPDMTGMLKSLGYHGSAIQDILEEIDSLFKEIDFEIHKQNARSATEDADAPGLINSLKDLRLAYYNTGSFDRAVQALARAVYFNQELLYCNKQLTRTN